MSSASNRMVLGIECGGSHSTACLAGEGGEAQSTLNTLTFGPANLRLLDETALLAHFSAMAGAFPRPDALAIGMPGARTEADLQRILTAAAVAWPGVPCHATHDLELALQAGEPIPGQRAQVLVLSGTGSCCYGRTPGGQTAKLGGWGHLLGDKGSGYEIGLRALKAVVYYLDRDGKWPALGERLLGALLLNEPNALIPWVQSAPKNDIAALALEVFRAWEENDRIATDILEGASLGLARDAVHCGRRLAQPGEVVQFLLAGSILLRQPRFARQVGERILQQWPNARVMPLTRPSAWGAVILAREKLAATDSATVPGPKVVPTKKSKKTTPKLPPAAVLSTRLSPTEERNPRSMTLDRLPVTAAVELMLGEDAQLPGILLQEKAKIAQAVRWITKAFKQGGRLLYVGAGSSGRLGVLDASECPPTFRTPPEQVQGIIAGGQGALWKAVEGAEDDSEAGARMVMYREVTPRDVVVGIAASGRTPFVWGALDEGRKRGATTILICFNPYLKIPAARRPDLVIAPNLGPELLTGSTRLKAGTATKMLLNIFSTLAMVQTGKVISNLMVDVNASNVKLRERAVRIVRDLTGTTVEEAQGALEQSGWAVTPAVQALAKPVRSATRTRTRTRARKQAG